MPARKDDITPIGAALGRVPTGLYIVSARAPAGPVGFVGSFVMQVGFRPPTVCVAIGHGRPHLDAIRRHGSFALSILDARSRKLMGSFLRAPPGGQTAFDGLARAQAPSGCPVLTDALAWLDCRVVGEYEGGDHTIVFGEVTAAEALRGGDPSVHLRSDGLQY